MSASVVPGPGSIGTRLWSSAYRFPAMTGLDVFFSDGFRWGAERVDHLDITHVSVFLKVLRQKVAAVTYLSGGDNQSVPPGQLVTILDSPRSLNNTGVYGYWAPGEKETHVFARTLWVHAGLELVCHRYVKLIEDLKAQSACLLAP
jgi:hypothetical protein